MLEFYPAEERIVITKLLLTKTLSYKYFYSTGPLQLYICQEDEESAWTLNVKGSEYDPDAELLTANSLAILMELRELINENELYYAGARIEILYKGLLANASSKHLT
ncbi:hypothetical protein [Xanthocytophaga flava]|uniref:hypothetical protein n=1 Tax=Xanthocytophaga flava TaxID=3048013 RepID=UPI0028D56ADC|nr:hypothetical protein [Xanthocytophaga flavus]MDJ1469090.1 hypothetical protein [Xanthocytophaga flavus]